MNSRLQELQTEWAKECDIYSLSKENRLSQPFCYAVTDHYLQSKRNVMIVGQEARNFYPFSKSWSFDEMQQYTRGYTDSQLRNDGIYQFNGSPFWKLFRELNSCGIEPAWNNVDKFHRIIDDVTYPLTVDIERKISKPYGAENKSLLKREIEESNPMVVLFVTGPNYHETMALSLGIDDDILKCYCPDTDNLFHDISNISGLGIPTLWSYHPRFLSYKEAISSVVNTISNVIDY